MSSKIFKGATVLVTGASSGIGEAFAHNLAKRGANLILTARSQDKLAKIADELRGSYRISVHVFPVDLILPDAPTQLFERIKASELSVDVLINNAGFGKWAHFLGENLDTYEQMLSLNINALVRLTYLCVPDMLARGQGRCDQCGVYRRFPANSIHCRIFGIQVICAEFYGGARRRISGARHSLSSVVSWLYGHQLQFDSKCEHGGDTLCHT